MFSTCFYTSLGLLSEIVVVVVFSQWHVYVIVHIPYKCSSICALQYNLYISQTVFQPWTFKVVYKLNLLHMYFGSARARAHTHTHTHTYRETDREVWILIWRVESGIFLCYLFHESMYLVLLACSKLCSVICIMIDSWYLRYTHPWKSYRLETQFIRSYVKFWIVVHTTRHLSSKRFAKNEVEWTRY